jgi:hypothetical protein
MTGIATIWLLIEREGVFGYGVSIGTLRKRSFIISEDE